MKLLSFIFLFISQAAFAYSVCNHGAPQRLGFEKAPLMAGLPNLTLSSATKSTNPFLKQLKLKSDIDASIIPPMKRRMKVLLLSATDDPALEPTITLAKKTLNDYGIPYEHHFLVSNKVKVNSLPQLINSQGYALYYAVILSTGQLAYANEMGNFQSALNPEEWSSLNSFELKYKIRSLSLYTFPNPTLGLENQPLETPGKAVVLNPTDDLKKMDPAYTPKVSFDLSGSWAYAAKVIDASKAKPILYYDTHLDNEGKPAVAGALIKTNDGRDEMHYFFAQSIYFTSSVAISSAWVKWLTNDMYIGKRRIYVNAHIDDVFLSTGLYSKYEDPTFDGPFAEKFVYRLTPDDLDLYVKQQEKALRPLANNPDFRIDMAFNGNGIMEHGGYAQDTLLKKAQDHLTDFTWLTHTFTHGDLNWLPYKQSKWELTTNILVRNDFIRDNTTWFSKNSIVTPRISGLFNPGALQAMDEVGIHYAVGDNTRKELLPQNIHHGLYTTKEFNGYDGIFIIPRYATEIYYNTSLPNELADEYNFIYGKYFGRDSTPEEIYERERLRVTKQLLSFEYAPYMFHQANLRSFKWKNGRESLVGLWLKEILFELRKYTTLPVLTAKMDDLAPLYLKRRAMDACEAEVWQLYSDGEIQALKVNTKNSCPLWITMPTNLGLEGWSSEKYGVERTYENQFTNNQVSVYKIVN